MTKREEMKFLRNLLVMVSCLLIVSSGQNIVSREKGKIAQKQEEERESLCERMV